MRAMLAVLTLQLPEFCNISKENLQPSINHLYFKYQSVKLDHKKLSIPDKFSHESQSFMIKLSMFLYLKTLLFSVGDLANGRYMCI